ncbi:MAG: hypothetical protein ACPGO3_00285 [Magnetospiraceae bacterium]
MMNGAMAQALLELSRVFGTFRGQLSRRKQVEMQDAMNLVTDTGLRLQTEATEYALNAHSLDLLEMALDACARDPRVTWPDVVGAVNKHGLGHAHAMTEVDHV